MGDAMQSPTQRPWFDRLAHDLRSPLTSLQTAAYLLRSDPGGSNTKELADIVVRQAQRMGKMIEELDDWSRAEQGRLVDATETLDLDGALDMALAGVQGCMLEPMHLGNDANGLVVRADGTRLPQLFRTMLTRHPSLQVQLANVKKAKEDYRLENFRLYPSVTLHGSAVDVTDFSSDGHLFIAGATVDIPIFDFGAQLDTVRARRDSYSAEQARLGAVGNDLASDLVRIYREIYALSERILSLQVEAGKLDRDLRVAQSQQQQGIATPLTAIEAELALIGKQEELEVDRARRLLLYAELQKAMGGTWKWIP